MNRIIESLFVHPVDRDHRIVELATPIKVAGMSMETDMRRIYRDVPLLGKRYREFKQDHPIPNLAVPWAFVAVSQGFEEVNGQFTYLLGDVVTDFAGLPLELLAFEIPPMTCAVFTVRPKNKWGWPMAIGSAKRYIFRTWLPSSPYEPGHGISDFEYHDERSTRRANPEIDLYVPIRERDQS